MQVRGYPTIKMFPAGKKDGEATDYDGGRTASDIVAWALDKVAENIPPPEVLEVSYPEFLEFSLGTCHWLVYCTCTMYVVGVYWRVCNGMIE